ncbi:MarR family winged helix-turn-helix transcriptional regulator [Nitrososphaera viennensis]|uniref:MarR family transcriptional regulator n=2 Tax=Nitrososphaera viennensis TaxID=1034015 RepID=A0A977ICC8_9ARCH|nr:MarR family transcriptional regulator [Nitrososphaera viennensis]UVS68394.1 MarR family transcriptional regulator [Nitrososphaera viennensis]
MKREEIIEAIGEKFTEMSTETILFHQAVADIVGLHITDHKCMHFIHRFGAMPAGRLAELTGLTTGAVTGIIDRLEKAGYVRRMDDPKDRRRTIVEPIRNKKLERKIEMIFMPLHERMQKLLSSYSDSELAFLLDAVTKTVELTHEESKKLSLQRQSSMK